MAKCGVYAIVSRIDGKVYVGSTVNIRRRWSHHRSTLRRQTHRNRYLQNAWNLHGEANFEFVVLEEVGEALSMVEREQAWLDRVRPFERDLGYNLLATAYTNVGFRFSDEQRANVSAGLKGKPKSAEHRANLWANREKTDEYLDQMSRNGAMGHGRPKSEEHRRKIGTAQRGEANHRSKLTEADVLEIRRRLSTGEKGRALAAEFGVHESIVSEIKSGRHWRHVQLK